MNENCIECRKVLYDAIVDDILDGRQPVTVEDWQKFICAASMVLPAECAHETIAAICNEHGCTIPSEDIHDEIVEVQIIDTLRGLTEAEASNPAATFLVGPGVEIRQ